ncbi:MAG: hypothetical protein U9R49_12705, partial [Bacteroidota bacterium]|nr:hypothetical protein [Bacteroidota bacterium]
FRWLDTGDGQSAVQYKLSLGQFKATLDYTIENQGRDPVLLPGKIENLQQFVRIAKQSDRTIRWARVMVVVLLFLLVMGIPRFIRSIGYKRFAASLYFDAVFRPMLLSDLNAWYSTQRMAVAFLGLYLFAWVVCSSFISWRIPLILGTLGLIPVIMYTLFSHSSEKLPSRFLSFMAPKMLLLIPVLGIVALRGPNFFWHRIWGMELFRMFFFSLTTLLIFHKLRVNMILIRKWTHGSRGGSAALVFLALGIQLLVTGTLLYSFGPEESLATLNSEVQLLPGTLIGSPSELLKWLMPVAGILSVLTFLYTHTNRRKENKSIKS